MISDIISERELAEKLALWLVDNNRCLVRPVGVSREEFAQSFTLPDIDYEYVRSYYDGEGSIVSLFRGAVRLSDWETQPGKGEMQFTVYKVMKTPAQTPGVEPYTAGYIIAD